MESERVAVVTGGNKGIGFGIVRALCKKFDGVVFLTARDEGKGLTAVQELNKDGLHPKFHLLDVTKHESIVKLKDFLQKKYGGLDVLVNNAGMAFKASTTAPHGEQTQVTLNCNFFGLIDVCDVLFPILRPHARVCNLSSMVSQCSLAQCSDAVRAKLINPNITRPELIALINDYVQQVKAGTHQEAGYSNSAYGMSKIGVTVMTIVQQKELDKQGAEDIVVNSCCPGQVDTDMTGHKGKLTIDQGAEGPVYLALLPPNVKSPRGNIIKDLKVVPWV